MFSMKPSVPAFLTLFLIFISQSLSSKELNKVDGSKQCDANGVCVAKVESKVSRFANENGAAPDVDLSQCSDRHHNCNAFLKQGECTKNPGIMLFETGILISLFRLYSSFCILRHPFLFDRLDDCKLRKVL